MRENISPSDYGRLVGVNRVVSSVLYNYVDSKGKRRINLAFILQDETVLELPTDVQPSSVTASNPELAKAILAKVASFSIQEVAKPIPVKRGRPKKEEESGTP
jgi:hypothetical protein